MQEITNTPHLQTEQIDGLIDAAGVDGAREILDAFWRSTTELLQQLEQEVAAGDFASGARTAHGVKGSAANVGAQRLSDRAAALEIACKDNDDKSAAMGMEALKDDFAGVRTAFEAHINGK